MTPVPGGAERAPSPWPEALRRAGPSRAGRGLTLPAASGPRRLTSRTFPKAQRGVGESSEKSFYPPPPAQRPVLLFLLPQSKRDCPGPAVPPPRTAVPGRGAQTRSRRSVRAPPDHCAPGAERNPGRCETGPKRIVIRVWEEGASGAPSPPPSP